MPNLVHDIYGYGIWLLKTFAPAGALGSILTAVIVGQIKQKHYL